MEQRYNSVESGNIEWETATGSVHRWIFLHISLPSPFFSSYCPLFNSATLAHRFSFWQFTMTNDLWQCVWLDCSFDVFEDCLLEEDGRVICVPHSRFNTKPYKFNWFARFTCVRLAHFNIEKYQRHSLLLLTSWDKADDYNLFIYFNYTNFVDYRFCRYSFLRYSFAFRFTLSPNFE